MSATLPPQAPPATIGPLKDTLVLDLSRLVSGNVLTHVLADLGATVLKVESPQGGDDLRAWQRAGVSTYWAAYSRNKQSIALNLRSAAGMAHLERLLGQAQVLVENFRPGTLEKMGLSPERLQALNPRLVVIRISGYGQTGALAHKPGFGSLVEGLSGFAALNGFPDREPVLPPFAMADSVCGLYGASLAMAWVHHQQQAETPSLKTIDLSLFEPLFGLLGPHAAEYHLTGQVPQRSGSRSPTHAPRNVYQSRDGKWFALSAGMAGTLQRLFEALDLPDALSDPRFATHEARLRHVQALDELLQSRFQTRDLDELMDLFDACDVTAGPILTIADLMQHPQVTSRELLVDVDSPQGVRIPVHGVPHQVNGVRPPIRASAPKLGEHNARWGIPALDDPATP